MENKIAIIKDLKEKSILISKDFNAPVKLVWKAFTEKEILDQWWGPAPWRAETKFQDFKEGGYWLYAMISPEGEIHWARMNYLSIHLHRNFQLEDVFCDENGIINTELPISQGINQFSPTSTGTKVEYKLLFSSEAQLQKITEMGFEQGITACFEQLDQYLNRHP